MRYTCSTQRLEIVSHVTVRDEMVQPFKWYFCGLYLKAARRTTPTRGAIV
jgi:hypothetical protein